MLTDAQVSLANREASRVQALVGAGTALAALEPLHRTSLRDGMTR